MFDAVFWGSILSVLIAVAVLVWLVYKVIRLMNEDAQKNKSQE